MSHKQNRAEDIVLFGGNIDPAKADAILEQWLQDHPVPRSLKLIPYLPVNQAWMLLIGGPAGHNKLWCDLDTTQPLTVAEVIRQSGRLIDNWRAAAAHESEAK